MGLSIEDSEASPFGQKAIALWFIFVGVIFEAGVVFIVSDAVGPWPYHLERLPSWGVCAALLASAIGFYCVLGVALPLWNNSERKRKVCQKYPDQPWLWRDEWVSGRVRSVLRSQADALKAGIAGCILLGAILEGLPALVRHVGFTVTVDRLVHIVFSLPFVIAAILFPFWFVRRRQARMFSNATFALNSVPAVPGSILQGTIELPEGCNPGTAHLRLRCRELVPSGDSSVTHTLWEQTVNADISVEPISMQGAIPVKISIPLEAKPTGRVLGGYGIFWELTVTADLPGPDLYADFEIPVFNVERTTHGMIVHREAASRWSWRGRRKRGLRIFAISVAGYGVFRISLPYLSRVFPVTWEMGLASHLEISSTPNPSITEALDRLGKQILAGVPEQPYRFRFLYLDSDDVNAFALPAGTVVVQRGLLKDLRSSDELSGVLAHEIEHVLQRHALRQWLHHTGLFAIVSLVWGTPHSLDKYVRDLAEMQNSRSQEREADEEGMKLLSRTGLSGEGMVRLFERWSREHQQTPETKQFFSTHPSDPERSARLRNLLTNLPQATRRPAIQWSHIQAELGIITEKGESAHALPIARARPLVK